MQTSKRKVSNFFIFILLSIGGIFMVAPLLWMASTSFKSREDVFALPPKWIPDPFHFEKYSEIWEKGPLLSGFENSLIVALSVTIVGTLTSSLAAFAFSKLKFPHKNKLFLMLIASIMIPYPVVMIPQFMMFSKIGWVDTLLPLIIPGLLERGDDLLLTPVFEQHSECACGSGQNRRIILFRHFLESDISLNGARGRGSVDFMVYGDLERLFGADHLSEFAGKTNAAIGNCQFQRRLCDSNGLSVDHGGIDDCAAACADRIYRVPETDYRVCCDFRY